MGFFSRSTCNDTHDACGHCQDCKWWQGEARGTSDRTSLGLCMHAELIHFNLEVSAESGCNRFEPAPALAGAEAQVDGAPVFMPSFA